MAKHNHKLGDKFVVEYASSGFVKGAIVTLNRIAHEDSTTAIFAGPNFHWKNAYDDKGNRIEGAWLNFAHVVPYVEPVKLTPAQELGYKIGDKFVVTQGCTYPKGSIITLHRDDGSTCPLFSGEGTHFRCVEDPDGGKNLPGAYVMLYKVEPYVEPVVETVPDETVEAVFSHYKGIFRTLYMQSLASSVKGLQDICYTASKDAGWWTDLKTGEALDPTKLGPEKIALMHSELSEALEGLRKGQMDDKLPHRPMAEVELADCIIRALDWAGAMGYDVGGAIVEKLEFNAQRADHKIENRQKSDGKKF